MVRARVKKVQWHGAGIDASYKVTCLLETWDPSVMNKVWDEGTHSAVLWPFSRPARNKNGQLSYNACRVKRNCFTLFTNFLTARHSYTHKKLCFWWEILQSFFKDVFPLDKDEITCPAFEAHQVKWSAKLGKILSKANKIHSPRQH